MEHVQKQHLSFNSRMGCSPFEVFLKISRSVVSRSCFELMSQINNLNNEKFYSKTNKLILKSNSRNTNWIVEPFKQVISLSTWQKINFKCTFCGFLSRRCKNVENVHETFINTKFPFKKVLSLAIEYTEYTSSFFRNLAALVWFKTSQAL